MNHTQLLAQIKLRETERQRDRLNHQYDAIEALMGASPTPLERLRALHEGLCAITFAQKPLHPDVVNLDALFLYDKSGIAPPELIADRSRLLERELAQGRLRAEFTYIFGRILSEWTGQATSTDHPSTAEDPLALLWQQSPAIDVDWLDALFQSNAGLFDAVAERVNEFATSEALSPVTNHEVLKVLRRLQRDVYANPALRRQAEAVSHSATSMNEHAGALTILLNNLDEWEWPDEGFPLRALWSRVKHHPHLDEDLITAMFLQIIGMRWGYFLGYALNWVGLQEVDNTFMPKDDPASLTSMVNQCRRDAQAQRFMQAPIGYSGQDPSVVEGEGVDTMFHLFLTLEREKRFVQAAFPDHPLYVVQLDLRRFYPSLSHELILQVMQHLGVTEKWRSFLQKFLRVIAQYQGGKRTVQRGVVLEHVLSDVMAECVMFFLDLHVYRTSGVWPIRVVDDVWVVTPSEEQAVQATRTVERFCQVTGLALNDVKSGSVCLGRDETPKELPSGRPCWGLLRLQSDGSWQIDEDAFARLEKIIRAHVEQSTSVMELVSNYNGDLRYLIRQLVLSVDLPGDHLRRMAQRLNQMHENLFGPEHGLVEEIHRRLRSSIADPRLKEQGLPTALIYWPITAGGLALDHPLLHVAVYLAESEKERVFHVPQRDNVATYLWKRKPKSDRHDWYGRDLVSALTRPQGLPTGITLDDVQEYRRARDNAEPNLPRELDVDRLMAMLWGEYYLNVVQLHTPQAPAPLPAMERLVNDFIQRGSEVSGQQQQSLSPYWRWVVYTYGPSLLEALGTFRFLLTELVPLQLILENLQSVRSEQDAQTFEKPTPSIPTERPPTPPKNQGEDGGGSEIPF